ncbi:MAG: hypothetical protein JW874_15670 [Spirochaetales bacterium]|nr:hypothetical protein [Spirochaetales bacterium]
MKYKDLIFGPTYMIDQFRDVYETQQYDLHGVMVASQVEADGTYLLFVNEYHQDFPVSNRGTYIIKRNQSDGKFVQAKVFLKNRSDCYMRLFPDGSKTRLDAVLFGYKVYENVSVPMDFLHVLLQPVSEIIRLTSYMVDWEMLLYSGNTAADRDISGMVKRIRSELPCLHDVDDGAMDSEGKLVFIETLKPQGDEGGFNCSGFAKWIIDGIVEPRTGSLLDIRKLKTRHPDIRTSSLAVRYEESRDPYFGLDWTRNLAMAADGREDNPERYDVRNVSFLEYGEDVGYPAAKIDLVLYQLAVRDPGCFYLGAVNGEQGEKPVMRQYYHIVVFFPYFDKNGSFQVAVMERNMETSLEQIRQRYPEEYIHLVRIQGTSDFELPRPFSGEHLFR